MAYVDNGVEMVTANPTLAKNIWYFIQSVDAPVGSKAVFPSWQTEGDTTYGGDSIDEQTKMGRIVMPSTNEDSIELTTYVAPGDKAIDIIKKAKHDGKLVKVWRVVVDERYATEEKDGEDTHQVFTAEFGYGSVDELELSDGDDLVEADYTLNIQGKLVDGTFPLDAQQLAALEAVAKYERPGETTGEPGASSN
ncbi:phage major tail protein, TP901-1 family [Weissella paramesenteroides]